MMLYQSTVILGPDEFHDQSLHGHHHQQQQQQQQHRDRRAPGSLKHGTEARWQRSLRRETLFKRLREKLYENVHQLKGWGKLRLSLCPSVRPSVCLSIREQSVFWCRLASRRENGEERQQAAARASASYTRIHARRERARAHTYSDVHDRHMHAHIHTPRERHRERESHRAGRVFLVYVLRT